MNQQMKKGIIELIILQLISNKKYYGYEISQYINEYIKVKESSVYIVLSRLEQSGYIDITKDKSRLNSKIVKYYKANSKGLEYLEDLLEENKKIQELINNTIKKSKEKEDE